jgi:hypothetical protein
MRYRRFSLNYFLINTQKSAALNNIIQSSDAQVALGACFLGSYMLNDYLTHSVLPMALQLFVYDCEVFHRYKNGDWGWLESKVAMRIFGRKKEQVKGERICLQLHNEVHHIWHSWPEIFRGIESRWMRWAGRENNEMCVYNIKRRNHVGDVGVDGKTVLKWILRAR